MSLYNFVLYLIGSLDGTPTLKGHKILGFGFWINKTSIQNDGDPESDIESLIVKLLQREDRAGAVSDAEFIIEKLKEILIDFPTIAKKIRFVSRF